MLRGAVAEIDLGAISHNLGVVRKATGNLPVIAVVKADAYGHGAVEVSKRLADGGVYCLAVAFTGEAVKLREGGVGSQILVLFDKCEVGDFFEYNLIPVIHDLSSARRFSEEAKKRNHPLDIHIKIDTGMGRIGLNGCEALEKITAITRMEFLRIRGLMSHFSDSDVADKSFAMAQLNAFLDIRDALTRHSHGPFLCHMANSAAVLSLKDAHLDAVRPGLMLYGQSPFQGPETARDSELIPAMKVKTKVLSLRKVGTGVPISYGRTFITRRESLVAVLPVGYADGYSRLFSNTADVLVRGKRAPVIGRVCMDLTMVDVTGIDGVEENDEVVILGRQGEEEIGADELASRAGTISYEVLVAAGGRSRRIYV